MRRYGNQDLGKICKIIDIRSEMMLHDAGVQLTFQGGVVDSRNRDAREPSSLGWLRPRRSRGFPVPIGGGVALGGRG